MSDPKMVMVKWGKKHFELGFTIHKFTSDFLALNQSRRLPPARPEVNLHWSWKVMKAYPNSDDPKRIFLLEQVSCPLIEVLWEKRANEVAFRQKRAKQSESGFHHINRNLTELERKEHRFAAIMTHSLYGEVIIPDILLRPLHKITYLDLMRKILIANPTKGLDLSALYELWNAILTKVYDYEYDWREDKKLEGVTASQDEYNELLTDVAQSKKRQYSEVEESSGDSDAPVAKTKQQKSKMSAKHTKAPKASGSSDATQTTIKTEEPTKVPRAAENSGISNTPSSTTEASIPAVAIKAEESDHDLSGAGPSISAPPPPVPAKLVAAKDTTHRPGNVLLGPNTRTTSSAPVIPTPTRSANAPPARAPMIGPNTVQPPSRRRFQPPPPSQASETHHSNNGEADRLSSRVAPWPYDPDTGEKTNGATEYRLSAREWTMLRSGIPPWPYDPKTGVKTKITTGYSLR